MSKRSSKDQDPIPRRRGAPKGNHNAFKHGLYSGTPSPPAFPDETSSNGAFKNEIAALRRIFFDYTLLYDQAASQDERDRAVQILSLLSIRMAQLARAQHFITPPEDPQWTELIRAGEAILSGKPVLNLFRPREDRPGNGHQDPPSFPLLDSDPGPPS
jgi:hypothetical protein